MSGTLIANLPAASTVLGSDLMIVEEVGAPNVTKRATAAQVTANSLPITGGTINGTVDFASGSLRLANNVPIQAKDSMGATHNIIAVDPSNNVDISNVPSGRLRFLNSAGTAELIGSDDSGNVGIETSLTVGGVAVVRNDGGSYNITVTAAGAVPWSGITGKPYSFNQSTDIGASVAFSAVAAANYGATNAYFLNGIGSTTYFAWNSGNAILALATNNYIFYNGSGNITYNASASHVFDGPAVNINGTLGVSSYIQTGSGLGGQGQPSWALEPSGNMLGWTGSVGLVSAGWVMAIGFGTASDARLKTDIATILPEKGVEWICAGRPVTYKRIGEDKKSAGFIAQEDWLSVVRAPSVTALESEEELYKESDGIAKPGYMLHRDYLHDIPYLTAALQWCVRRIKELEAR